MISKISNWLFGSFFRTIGRVLCYLVLGILLSYLISKLGLKIPLFTVLDVHAYTEFPDVNDIEFTINNNASNTNNRVFTNSGNVTFKLSSDTIFEYNGTSSQIKYGYISMCVSAKFNITTYTTGNFTKNFRPYMTDIPCQIYNTSAYPNSKVLYMTFDLNLGPVTTSGAMCKVGASSILCELNNGMTIYVTQSAEWTLNSFGFSSQPINYDSTSGNLISQNQTIINNIGQINSSITSSTNSIISSQNSNTNSIINNQNSNKNDIINNQNANSQAEIENANANTDKTIDSQKVCSYIDKSNVVIEGSYLSSQGNIASSTGWGITDYISINSSSELKILSTRRGTASFCFYNTNKTKLSCIYQGSYNVNDIIDIPEGTSYMRFNIYIPDNMPSYSLCKNGNQATNDKLDSMSNYLSDDTAPNSDISSLGTVQGLLPEGPVDSLLNIPFIFLSVLTSSISGTCVPLEGNWVFNSTLSIPCFDSMIYDNMPAIIMVFLNALPSAFILITYFKHLYKKVDRAVSMESSADDEWGVI